MLKLVKQLVAELVEWVVVVPWQKDSVLVELELMEVWMLKRPCFC